VPLVFLIPFIGTSTEDQIGFDWASRQREVPGCSRLGVVWLGWWPHPHGKLCVENPPTAL